MIDDQIQRQNCQKGSGRPNSATNDNKSLERQSWQMHIWIIIGKFKAVMQRKILLGIVQLLTSKWKNRKTGMATVEHTQGWQIAN